MLADRPTDRPTLWPIELLSQLKISNKIWLLLCHSHIELNNLCWLCYTTFYAHLQLSTFVRTHEINISCMHYFKWQLLYAILQLIAFVMTLVTFLCITAILGNFCMYCYNKHIFCSNIAIDNLLCTITIINFCMYYRIEKICMHYSNWQLFMHHWNWQLFYALYQLWNILCCKNFIKNINISASI